MSTVYKPTPELMAIPEADRIRWAEALESGDYKQGAGNLFRSDNCSYCCLGVLSILAGMTKDDINYESYPSHDVSIKMLSFSAHDSVFIDDIRAAKSLEGVGYTLPCLNDGFYVDNKFIGFEFKEIAQLLRGNEVTK